MSWSLTFTPEKAEKQRPVRLGSAATVSEAGTFSAERNPFSVRYVQPGAVPFFFEPSFIEMLQRKEPGRFEDYFIQSVLLGQEAATWIGSQFLADRFQRAGFRAQIAGPHGSGKSTLMNALSQALQERGLLLFSTALHDRQRSLPAELRAELEAFLRTPAAEETPNGEGAAICRKKIVFLDGFEQLSPMNRFLFRSFCRSHNLGFLLSSHTPVFGLSVLMRTVPSIDSLSRVIDYLLDDSPFSPTRGEIKELYLRNRGNFRSILFDLYDRYEESGLDR